MSHTRTKDGVRRQMAHREQAMVRRCCPTSLLEPHLPTCPRPERCGRKVGHWSRDRAKAIAAELGPMFGPMFGRMTPYRCEACGAWHIGHPMTAAEGLEL